MKKLSFLILLLFISSVGVQAQVNKGKCFLSGASQLGINFGSEKQKINGDVVDGYKNNFSNFNFQPTFGYVFVNQLVTGIFIDFEAYMENTKDGASDYFYRDGSLIAGPFVRYYIDLGDKLVPFVGARIGFGYDHSKSRYDKDDPWDKYNEFVFSYNTGVGATYFFNEMVGLDGFLGFQHESYTSEQDVEQASRSTLKTKYIYNELVGTIGIVILLGK